VSLCLYDLWMMRHWAANCWHLPHSPHAIRHPTSESRSVAAGEIAWFTKFLPYYQFITACWCGQHNGGRVRWAEVKLWLLVTTTGRRKWEWSYIASRVHKFGISWGWVVRFTPRPLSSGKWVSTTHWIGGRLDPRGSMDTLARDSCLCRGSNCDLSVVQPVP
jgi:hypothetical protein